MIVIDIFIALIAVALLLIGAPLLARKLLLKDPKRKEIEAAQDLDERGETNAIKFDLAERRRCVYCRAICNPARDLKVASSWMHQDCYLQQVTKDRGNA